MPPISKPSTIYVIPRYETPPTCTPITNIYQDPKVCNIFSTSIPTTDNSKLWYGIAILVRLPPKISCRKALS